VVKDPQTDEVVELRCNYDPETKGGHASDGRRVRGTIHWVSEAHALTAAVRLYDHLFAIEKPDELGADFRDALNPDSLETLTGCMVEPSLSDAALGASYQFERLGYFCVDSIDSKPGALVFNRAVSLRDTWARIEHSQESG
jgi:glutaminyl-tRNA synthetase